MGTEVSQIACGKRHTLALIPTRGRLYAFGLGGSGQLGNNTFTMATTPQVLAKYYRVFKCRLDRINRPIGSRSLLMNT